MTDRYLLGNDAPEAMDRFTAFAMLFDPSTFRHMDALGLAAGWRCWEVGAGGTSVVAHLAERVGPAGHVLATDIDVAWAADAAAPNVTVLEHDVAGELPPGSPFDLVHARLVLVHVPERDAAFPIRHPACIPLELATINLVRDQLVDREIATEAEIEQHLASVLSGRLDLTQPPMVSCWGWTPAA